MEPLVSVIIPNYNHSRFLKDRIDSVLNQTYRNIEVIILDDCSQDNSRDIINQYRTHSNISHIVFNEINSGSTFHQWHKGFALAKGEYIWIAESDDVASPDFIKKLLEAINGDTSVVLAASAITVIDENGIEINHLSISKTNKIKKYSSEDFIKENMLLGNHLFNASSAIFRKEALNSMPDDYSRLRASGDYLFWLEIALRGKIIEIPERLDFFRKSSFAVTPRLYGNGVTFEEALTIFAWLQEKGFIKGIYKNLVIAFRLRQIRKSNKFNNEDIRSKCYNMWYNQNNFHAFDSIILTIYGAYRKISRALKSII